MVRNVLSTAGHNVFTLTSDFSHAKKKSVLYDDLDIKALPTLRYHKNNSVIRFVSHFLLSLNFIYFYFKNRNKYDAVYITSPFVICAFFIGLINKGKTIVDIIDFWPDSLPFSNASVLDIGVRLWRKINSFSYRTSDVVISLSSTFLSLVPGRNLIKKQISLGVKSEFCKLEFKSSTLNVLYVGNIGKLYDFDTLIESIRLSKRKIKLHLVGGGDVLDELLSKLEINGVDFTYYGLVYEPNKLKDIISMCQVGFNGFTDKTNASFSYKSLTYFMHGLPIINSMQGDLYNNVFEYNLGFNYSAGNVSSLTKIFNNTCGLENKHKNIIEYFNSQLEYEIVAKEILNVFGD